MLNVHETLKSLKYFIDNEYLKKYSLLVERNTRTKRFPTKTHKHHIVPKSWFKLMSIDCDNTLSNLVNLPVREHILAHYYLCLCTADPFMFANQLALVVLQTKFNLTAVDKQLLHSLPMYNNIYENYQIKIKDGFKLYEEKGKR